MKPEPRPNEQPTEELNQFQKLIVQDIYIKKLNWWLDESRWECEKRDRIIEMREKEIDNLKYLAITLEKKIEELKNQFSELQKKYESVSGQKGKLLIRRGVFPK